MNNRTWYQINNAANVAEIDIFETIGQRSDGSGISAKDFIAELRGVTANTIRLSINSAGGQVFDGFAA